MTDNDPDQHIYNDPRTISCLVGSYQGAEVEVATLQETGRSCSLIIEASGKMVLAAGSKSVGIDGDFRLTSLKNIQKPESRATFNSASAPDRFVAVFGAQLDASSYAQAASYDNSSIAVDLLCKIPP